MAVTLNYVPHEAQRAIHGARRYEYEISSTGHLSYNAPSGYHDDCVIALALANPGAVAGWEYGDDGEAGGWWGWRGSG